jgi:hypothetical protein
MRSRPTSIIRSKETSVTSVTMRFGVLISVLSRTHVKSTGAHLERTCGWDKPRGGRPRKRIIHPCDTCRQAPLILGSTSPAGRASRRDILWMKDATLIPNRLNAVATTNLCRFQIAILAASYSSWFQGTADEDVHAKHDQQRSGGPR